MNPKLAYSLTKPDAIKIALYLYYSYPPFWKYLRIFGGPLMIILGGALLKTYTNLNLAFGVFVIGYGIYYMLKPIVQIWRRLKNFKPTKEILEYDEQNKVLKMMIPKVDIPAAKILSIRRLRWAYVLTIKIEKRQNRLVLSRRTIIDGDLDGFISRLVSIRDH